MIRRPPTSLNFTAEDVERLRRYRSDRVGVDLTRQSQDQAEGEGEGEVGEGDLGSQAASDSQGALTSAGAVGRGTNALEEGVEGRSGPGGVR